MKTVRLIYLVVVLVQMQLHAQPVGSPVAENGKLSVVGNKLVNQCGNPVQLKGMGSHGLMWFPKCYNESSIKALVDDWGMDVFEIKINYDLYYAKDTAAARAYVNNLVEIFTKLGVYVIIQNVEGASPLEWVDIVKNEFTYFCRKHKDKINVIYEPINEPHGEGGSWANCKAFAEQAIPSMRAIVPDAVIIMGTPDYCQKVNEAADNPLTGSWATNIVYSFHIYAHSHDNAKPLFNYASNKIPIFAAEWGVCTYTGSGELDYEATDIWLDMWNGNNPGSQKVSWCNHNFADGPGSACALVPGSCNAQTWNNTSASGTFIKEKILENDDWTSCNNAPKGIVVFENTLFGGKATKLGIGTYTSSQLQTRGISSNTISSIKVLNGYKVELFDGDNFTTPLGIATSNVSDLASIAANDKVSSLKISLANKPAIPTSLVLNPVSDASIHLTWLDNANNETNYLVQRATGVGGLVTIATLPANSKSYTSTQLLDKTVYYYRVVAINNEGFSPSMSKSAQTLVKLQNRTAPGKVEAEDYNWGGQNVAYYDSDLGNKSNKTYRNDDVDIQADTTLSNKYSVGFIVDNEWLNYSIDVQKSGNYKFLLRMSGFGGKVSVKVNNITVLSTINLPSTGGWATWISDSLGVLPLTVGKNELQLFVNKAGFNFDYFELTEVFFENEKVYFYQNTNYSGNSAFLTEGNYTTAQLLPKGIINNDVSSVKVPSGYTVELYDGDNFTGTKYTLSANEADLVARGFNDKTSSVKIIKTGTVTGSETAEIKNIEFAIYPNPNHGHFKVILPENVSSKLEVYNSLGQMVYQGSHVGDADLQLTGLPKGTYTLKVIAGDLSKAQKIVID